MHRRSIPYINVLFCEICEWALRTMTDNDDVLESLPLPEMTPVGLARQFGPGLILMMTGIGTSHLVTAPVAGGRFEFALLWVIPVAYIFKYYGFEMAFRFTNATGRSMLDAYSTAWHKWPVWYVLITTILQAALGQAGRLTAAAAVAYFLSLYYFGVDVEAYIFALVIGVLSVVLILSGRYGLVELVTKVCAGILLLSTVAVFLRSPAPLSGLAHFFIFETPEGSWLILAAFLGLLPTGMDVSLQASEWGKAKKAGMGRIRDHLEQRGLVETFDPFSSSKEALSVDTSKLPPPCPRILPAVVSHRPLGLSRRTHHLLRHRDDLSRARRSVDLSERSRRARRHRSDCADIHQERRSVDDDRVSHGCFRCDLFDGLQLF